jgi:hypothetical protein
VTLVYDDKIEKIGWIGLEQAKTALVLGEGLVDGKVHFPALDDLAGVDLVPSVAEGSEDPVLRLVHENVAIRQIQNAWSAVVAGPVPASVQSFQQIWKATTVFPRCG